VKVITDVHLASKLKMSGAVPVLLHALVMWTGRPLHCLQFAMSDEVFFRIRHRNS
jgi:hypothetical protein